MPDTIIIYSCYLFGDRVPRNLVYLKSELRNKDASQRMGHADMMGHCTKRKDG